jgi:TonB-dependent receptor-like protein
MRFAFPSVIAATLAGLAAMPVRAQQTSTVTFTVFAAETQAALAGAQVSVDARVRGVTDARGELRVDGLSAGTHGASVSLIGRRPRGVRLELVPGEAREVMVLLDPVSLRLAPLTASARPRTRDAQIEGFYQRAQNHMMGRFVTRAQIEEKLAVQFTDIFRGIPGVRVDPGPNGYVIRSNRAVSINGGHAQSSGVAGRGGGDDMRGFITGGDCPPNWFVDGVPFGLSGPLNTAFSPAEIEGVEIYFGNVPPQWGGSSAMCGVILIWTRSSAARATDTH